jgi:simple sugar transport system permease protein
VLVTVAVFVLVYAAAAARYPGFGSGRVLVNLLRDSALLGLPAIGLTFVILSGGIDLSVGAVVGLTSIVVARLVAGGLPPGAAIAVGLAIGTTLGAAMGGLITAFSLPPFLVTLAGMFLARGLAFVVSLESATIAHPLYAAVADFGLAVFPATAIVFLLAVVAGSYVGRHTSFGRNVYALGGNEASARLMGLPVARTKVLIYAQSGLFAALGGVVHTFYTGAGNPTAGTMLELDAIAAVVIGGTRLQGGTGSVAGTFVGVLILGVIQTVITFEGTLSSWWTKIAIGVLLLAFILLQRLLHGRTARALVPAAS